MNKTRVGLPHVRISIRVRGASELARLLMPASFLAVTFASVPFSASPASIPASVRAPWPWTSCNSFSKHQSLIYNLEIQLQSFNLGPETGKIGLNRPEARPQPSRPQARLPTSRKIEVEH